ncbi:EAL domain-containing protein [Peteryoungia ipomoeae]|uniref:EAL domain-containing protein n=2 Tax=Peteryoungia ipomoeae TaxID=1210932 RepID=A0A4S8P043_9HYPH|nr:EAL domain-containing protein [Peteryoungia ipomoeae]
MNLALIVADAAGFIRFVNPAFCEMFCYSQADILGKPVTLIVPERLRGAHIAGMANVSAGAKPGLSGRAVEVSALRAGGAEFPIEIAVSTWKDEGGNFWAGATIRDISERRERDARLMRLASQDTLTGLQNRHEFVSRLEDWLQTGQRGALALMDLDGFKEINDIHGHLIGDSVLQAVGVRLSYLLGDSLAIGRLGGDEFTCLLKDTKDAREAQARANSIVAAFRKPFSLGGLELNVGASIGIALAPEHGTDAEMLIASADFALSRAKAVGGRRALVFHEAMRHETQARRDMLDELRLALRNGELELYFQPQVDLVHQSVVGFEALIRWNHPSKGLLLPGHFLPALEQSSLATEIGWWTIDQACRMAAKVNGEGARYRIAVNLFTQQFRASNLSDRVKAALNAHHLRPDCLELEVTEQVTLNDDEASMQTLMAIRDIGVGVAFDDFGTGYASLSSLQRFPLTTLKIDRGFIRDIQTRKSDTAITRALVTMSREMGLRTVAEGIETESQAAFLRSLGCEEGQGYLYGRPMPMNDAIACAQQSETRQLRSASFKTQ